MKTKSNVIFKIIIQFHAHMSRFEEIDSIYIINLFCKGKIKYKEVADVRIALTDYVIKFSPKNSCMELNLT